MTTARPRRRVYRGTADDPFTQALRFDDHAERAAQHAAKIAALPPVHHECMALISAGLMPQSVARLARHLKNAALIKQALPSITDDEAARLAAGRSDVKYTAMGWRIISL